MLEQGDASDFRGATALVTGGAGGLGRAIATTLCDRGARVAVADLTAGDSGPAELAVACNVTDPDAVAGAVARTAAAFGSLQLLVCAAGVVSEAPIDELAVEEWHRVVDASLTGTFHAVRAAVPELRAAGGGSIVALSSGWARKAYPRGAHYAAAKAGVEALVRSAAAELAADGIRVNAVAPGPVRTPMLDDLPAFDEAARAAAIPLGRIAEPEDVVAPVLFLLGPGSGFVTGEVIAVNGGLGL